MLTRYLAHTLFPVIVAKSQPTQVMLLPCELWAQELVDQWQERMRVMFGNPRVLTLIGLLLVLSPHIGVLLLSFASVWSFAPLPDGYTLAHYNAVFEDSSGMIANTLL